MQAETFVSIWAQPSETEAEKAERQRLAKLASLEFLRELFRDPAQPMRLRYMAASDVAAYENVKFKAVAQVTPHDFASALEAARLRSKPVLKVISALPKALPPGQHDADELKPNHSRSPEANGSGGGFKRRI
jgi:hypothetical protein